jgi:hypothetical protein
MRVSFDKNWGNISQEKIEQKLYHDYLKDNWIIFAEWLKQNTHIHAYDWILSYWYD